ncbi:hypothetical protein MIND_01240900 [Mycena indigotica]|uniref:Uncharacterized protein n=1 Tax=Mycena indigotica TaxID=2126181 RepID=A0A8H6VSF4_9AGAR|nr:uncharacterized protein MIND_01240900 [Mycena indigotica]KAF7292139.1 hypothetical protein MIND_01240900 [Mycena indigotica]
MDYSFRSVTSVVPRGRPEEVASQNPAAVMAFNILSATGFILLLLTFVTAALSRTVRRVSTWYTYIAAWAIYCLIPFPILGHQTRFTSPPGLLPCAVDAAMMYASRPYAGFATLALLLHLYITISTRLKRTHVPRWFVVFLMTFPVLVYLSLFLGTLIVGLRNASLVELEPGGYYCHLTTPIPTIICAALVGFVTIAVLVIEVLTFILLCRHWRAFRALQRRNEPGVELGSIIRVSAFAILPFVGLVLSFLTYVPRLVGRIFPVYNLLLAFLPVAAALIFGSQTDILDAMAFWRRVPRPQGKNGPELDSSTQFSTIGTFSSTVTVSAPCV